jgi:hypothetical protein
MAAHSFEDLRRHIGHDIHCIYYGDQDDPTEVALECYSCCETLTSYEIGDTDNDTPPYPEIVDDLLEKKELLPLLIGVNEELDRLIEQRMKETESHSEKNESC